MINDAEKKVVAVDRGGGDIGLFSDADSAQPSYL